MRVKCYYFYHEIDLCFPKQTYEFVWTRLAEYSSTTMIIIMMTRRKNRTLKSIVDWCVYDGVLEIELAERV